LHSRAREATVSSPKEISQRITRHRSDASPTVDYTPPSERSSPSTTSKRPSLQRRSSSNDGILTLSAKARFTLQKSSSEASYLNIHLKAMKEELDKQASYLTLIVYEPNLFFYNFPSSSSYHDFFLKI
jgi:hypothetical protein